MPYYMLKTCVVVVTIKRNSDSVLLRVLTLSFFML